MPFAVHFVKNTMAALVVSKIESDITGMGLSLRPAIGSFTPSDAKAKRPLSAENFTLTTTLCG
jgi:hypothetical protein